MFIKENIKRMKIQAAKGEWIFLLRTCHNGTHPVYFKDFYKSIDFYRLLKVQTAKRKLKKKDFKTYFSTGDIK